MEDTTMKRENFDDGPLGERRLADGYPFDLVHVRTSRIRSQPSGLSHTAPPPEPPGHDWPSELDPAFPAGAPYRRSVRQVLVQIAGWSLIVISLWGVTRMVAVPRAREAIFEWVTLGHERQVRAVKRTVEGTFRGIVDH
jgi:hypothetical protein